MLANVTYYFNQETVIKFAVNKEKQMRCNILLGLNTIYYR